MTLIFVYAQTVDMHEKEKEKKHKQNVIRQGKYWADREKAEPANIPRKRTIETKKRERRHCQLEIALKGAGKVI